MGPAGSRCACGKIGRIFTHPFGMNYGDELMSKIPFNHTFFHIATVTPEWEPYDPADKKSFPHPVYHRPVAVSVLRITKGKGEGDDGQVDVNIVSRTISNLDGERELVAAFFKNVPGDTSFLVSFQGRSFCLPVMVYRALRHGVDASQYLQEQEVFTARYSSQHVDLADFLSGYGATYGNAQLSEYAKMLGLAKRPYIDVGKRFEEGELQVIQDRLEVDVMIIAAIYFRLLLSQGRLDIDNFRVVSKKALRCYFDRNNLAQKYLEDSSIKEYFRAGEPTAKKTS